MRLSMSTLPHNRPHFLLLVLIRLKLREDIDEFADAPGRQRLAGVEQRIVVGDPGLGFRQFLYRRTRSNDLGDGHIVDFANRLHNVVTRETSHALIPSSSDDPPAA